MEFHTRFEWKSAKVIFQPTSVFLHLSEVMGASKSRRYCNFLKSPLDSWQLGGKHQFKEVCSNLSRSCGLCGPLIPLHTPPNDSLSITFHICSPSQLKILDVVSSFPEPGLNGRSDIQWKYCRKDFLNLIKNLNK